MIDEENYHQIIKLLDSMSGNHTAGGQSSVPDDGQDAQNPNQSDGGTLSNRQQRADRIRALPVFRFRIFALKLV